MTLRAIIVVVLLGGGVLVELLCCLGVLLMRRAIDRLHFLGPASFLGSGLIAAAILVNRSGFQAGVKAVVIFLALLVFSPILSHATGRIIQLTEGQRDGVGDQVKLSNEARPGVPEGQS